MKKEIVEEDYNDKMEEDEEGEEQEMVAARKLIVHAAGPIMDQLHLSWLNHSHHSPSPSSLTRGARKTTATFPSVWMCGGKYASGEVGIIRQVVPLNQYQESPSDLFFSSFLSTAPPTCFVRGTSEAALFQLLPTQEGGEGEENVPYYLNVVQKLQVSYDG